MTWVFAAQLIVLQSVNIQKRGSEHVEQNNRRCLRSYSAGIGCYLPTTCCARERSQLECADAASRRRGRRRKGTRKGREAAPLRRGEEHLELRACDGIVHIRAQIADGINASLSIELFLARKTKDLAAR